MKQIMLKWGSRCTSVVQTMQMVVRAIAITDDAGILGCKARRTALGLQIQGSSFDCLVTRRLTDYGQIWYYLK